MKGRIRPYPGDVCPKCGADFKSVLNREGVQTDILCGKGCMIPPRRFLIDVRSVGDRSGNKLGYLKRDRRGTEFTSFPLAMATISAVWDEMRQNDGYVDVSKWKPSAMKEITLRAVGDAWITTVYQEVERVTAKHWESGLKHHIYPQIAYGRVVGDMDVRDLQGEGGGRVVEAIRTKLFQDGKEPSSIKSIMATFRRLLVHIERIGIITKAPYFRTVKVPKKIRAYTERHEQDIIMAHLPKGRKDMFLLCRVLQETGLRPGEGCALRVESLRDDGVIEAREAINNYGEIKSTKTGDEFERVITEELMAELKEHAKGKFARSFLFVSRFGTPYVPNWVSKKWKEAGIAAKIRKPLNVSMRHSRVSHEVHCVLKKDYHEKIRQVLQHRSVVTTLHNYVLEKPKENVTDR